MIEVDLKSPEPVAWPDLVRLARDCESTYIEFVFLFGQPADPMLLAMALHNSPVGELRTGSDFQHRFDAFEPAVLRSVDIQLLDVRGIPGLCYLAIGGAKQSGHWFGELGLWFDDLNPADMAIAPATWFECLRFARWLGSVFGVQRCWIGCEGEVLSTIDP